MVRDCRACTSDIINFDGKYIDFLRLKILLSKTLNDSFVTDKDE